MADKTISGLQAATPAQISDATVFEVQVPGLSAPESRKITWAELKSIMPAASGKKRVPFVYDANGAHEVSAGVTRIDIETLGGGGGGGTGALQGGGAGGGYAMKCNVVVDPADELTVTVGAGGSSDDPGDPGGDSKVEDDEANVLCHATGGGGGITSAGEVNGGVGVVGDIMFDGEQSVGGVDEAQHWILGGAGGGPLGGNGSTFLSGSGSGDAGRGGGGAQAAPGGDGMVIIWEYQD